MPDNETGTTITQDAAQAEIAWVDDLMVDFKPKDAIEEVSRETEEAEETKSDPQIGDGVAKEPDVIDETKYEQKVAIKGNDGTTVYKTVKQLIQEGMMDADYRRKTQETAEIRGKLEEDSAIINLLNEDKYARDFLQKRIDDIKAGRKDDDEDIEFDEEVIKQVPALKKLADKVRRQEIELNKYRKGQEQTQTNQAVGKIDSVLVSVQTELEKEIGSHLESGVFRGRVGKLMHESLSDTIPNVGERNSIIAQLILADKTYFLSKARDAYRQEIELNREKSIEAAKLERAKKTQSAQVPLNGGSSISSKDTGELKVIKGKDGKPDLGAFLERAFSPKA